MVDPDRVPAHWIGEIIHGKTLREPINIVLLDPLGGSVEESKTRLIEGCSQAGYPSRRGHSSGYSGCIDGQLYGQLPEGEDDAFSDAPFVLDNNHGRIFGPSDQNSHYLYLGAFSREKVVPLAKVRHQYVSFNRARDDLAGRLVQSGTHEITGYVSLDNVLIDGPITTGDHDGIAVVLTAVA